MIELNQNLAADFLTKNNITNFSIKKIAGDASFRSYYRIFFSDKTLILMFAPPNFEDTKPFVKIAEILIKNKLNSPKILAIDEDKGFILLSDFGDETYTKKLVNLSDQDLTKTEFEIYQKAIDAIIEVQKIKDLSAIPIYNNAVLFREVMLFVDWYLKMKNIFLTFEEVRIFKKLFFELFDQLNKNNKVLVLRDFHADNLMILPDNSVGLLDFQDALIGSDAYDLVSLIEDARRDIDEKNREKLIQYFIDKNLSNSDSGSNFDADLFIKDYSILSLQRNLKILGIFARLAIRDKKTSYLNYLPRVANFVEKRISSHDQNLSQISQFLKKFF
jgi:hypothetical protein